MFSRVFAPSFHLLAASGSAVAVASAVVPIGRHAVAIVVAVEYKFSVIPFFTFLTFISPARSSEKPTFLSTLTPCLIGSSSSLFLHQPDSSEDKR